MREHGLTTFIKIWIFKSIEIKLYTYTETLKDQWKDILETPMFVILLQHHLWFINDAETTGKFTWGEQKNNKPTSLNSTHKFQRDYGAKRKKNVLKVFFKYLRGNLVQILGWSKSAQQNTKSRSL